MTIPGWLYERLPLIYFAAGAASLWFFGASLAGLPSAVLFCAAGWWVHALRRSGRQAARARQQAQQRRARSGGGSARGTAPHYAGR